MLSNPTGTSLRYAQGPGEVHLPRHRHLDALGLYAHRLGDHLAGYLGAGGEGPEQQVARAGRRPGPADARVGLGLVDRAADVHGAGDRGVLLARLGLQRDPATSQARPGTSPSTASVRP